MKGSGRQITQEEFLRIGRALRARFRQAGVGANDLDDLVQETFLHAQESLDEGRFEKRSSLDTWIVGIGKKRLLKFRDRSRAAKRKAAGEIPLDDPKEAQGREGLKWVAADPTERLHLEQVVDSLHQLPTKLRDPLVLIANGRSYKETAVALGITTDLVTSRVHQARSKLRELHSRHRLSTS